jgi:glycosyltransferase involved in cell wall biosynthesis
MKPYISIVLPTMRPGGLDIVFSSLANQTFKDFELIIVDNIYEYRKDIVKEKAKSFDIRYKHVPPRINKFPTHAFSSTINTAITYASGGVILFTLDYRYFMPWSLQKHADFHRAHQDNEGLSCPTKFVLSQSLKKGLPSYGTDGLASFDSYYEKYVQDLKDGKLDDFMWSIYESEVMPSSEDPSEWQERDKLYGYDPKTDMPTGTPVSPLLCFLQGESIKTNIVLAANGLNEEFDGAPNYQDIEFSHRLRNLFGFQFYCDNTNTTYRVNGGHNIIPKIQLVQSVCDKAQSIFKKYENGSIDLVNDWSLSEAHVINTKE